MCYFNMREIHIMGTKPLITTLVKSSCCYQLASYKRRYPLLITPLAKAELEAWRLLYFRFKKIFLDYGQRLKFFKKMLKYSF